ncbi:hypothetical protein AGMMS50268_34170 [Spirochaetia bacterium]|nr:hypothetical protein AGMMS50268_34170 [Spirochaetia bacterium]
MFSASFGTFGTGYNVSSSGNNQFEINLTTLNSFFEYPGYYVNPKARIGLEMYPFRLRILPITQDTEMSFFNINLFSDFLGPKNKDRWDYIRFGPFVSLNWLTVNNLQMDIKNYVFSSGLRLTLLSYTETNIRFQVMDMEIGYRSINNINNFYFTIKFDFIDGAFLPFLPFFPFVPGFLPAVLERMFLIGYDQ